MAQVTLELVAQGGWVRCDVTFPHAGIALDTIKRWKAEDEAAGRDYSGIWAEETDELRVYTPGRVGPLSKGEFDLLDHLYPQCHHGLSAQLCGDPYGDNHWGSYEQEKAAAGY
jgi:hypothetical protein